MGKITVYFHTHTHTYICMYIYIYIYIFIYNFIQLCVIHKSVYVNKVGINISYHYIIMHSLLLLEFFLS